MLRYIKILVVSGCIPRVILIPQWNWVILNWTQRNFLNSSKTLVEGYSIVSKHTNQDTHAWFVFLLRAYFYIILFTTVCDRYVSLHRWKTTLQLCPESFCPILSFGQHTKHKVSGKTSKTIENTHFGAEHWYPFVEITYDENLRAFFPTKSIQSNTATVATSRKFNVSWRRCGNSTFGSSFFSCMKGSCC